MYWEGGLRTQIWALNQISLREQVHYNETANPNLLLALLTISDYDNTYLQLFNPLVTMVQPNAGPGTAHLFLEMKQSCF